MVTRVLVAGAAILLLAVTAAAEQLPAWDVSEICRDDSAPGQCRIAEAHARNTISATWDLLPTDLRTACIAQTRAPAGRSWRILATCIEGEVLRAKSGRAIATRSTPAEPEPPQLPAPAEPASSAEPAPAPAESAMPDEPGAPATPDQPVGENTPAPPPGSAGQQ